MAKNPSNVNKSEHYVSEHKNTIKVNKKIYFQLISRISDNYYYNILKKKKYNTS